MNEQRQFFILNMPANDLLVMASNCNAHFFASDLNGKLLMANDLTAGLCQADSASALIGQNFYPILYKISRKIEADIAITNTIGAINTNTPHVFYETCLGRECLCIKTRLLNSHGSIVGAGGIALYHDEVAVKDLAMLLNKLIYSNLAFDKTKREHILDTKHTNKLSLREQECADYLIKNMTYREISLQLGISCRTVEKHVENIKNKLECSSRLAVVNKILLN